MSRKVKQAGVRLLAVILLAAAISFQSLAATGRISFSDPSTQVGQEVSVTMKFTSTSGEGLGHTDVMLSYDASALQFISGSGGEVSGDAGALRVKHNPPGNTEAVTELRFKALKAGTATITVTNWEGYDDSGQPLGEVRQGTSTITVRGLETSSDDATLRSLQVSPGTLDPAFSPSQETYTVSVGLDVDKLTVSAEKNNDKANVAVEGADSLQEGENTVLCKVTAEDGTTVKTYTLTVNKVEGGESAPASAVGGTEASEAEVLVDLDMTTNMKYRKIHVIELPDNVEVPAGFTPSIIRIGGTKVSGWKWAKDEEPRYCVFYGMNEDGEQDFYRFDLKEGTIQRYFADENATSKHTDDEYNALGEDYNSLLEDYQLCRILMFGSAAAAVVLLVVLIAVLWTTSRRRGGGNPDVYDDERRPSEDRAARTAGGRRPSREERYMMGEEEDYEEDGYAEEVDAEAYQPEPVYQPGPEEGRKPEDRTVSAGNTAVPGSAGEDMERDLEKTLAKEAAATADTGRRTEHDDDDFEFLDIDDEN